MLSKDSSYSVTRYFFSLIYQSDFLNTPHDNYRLVYHLIHLSCIRRLICCQVYNMLEILRNRNCLKHCIYHYRMLHLSFLQHSISNFLKIFGLSSGSLLTSFLESNTQILSFARFVLTKYTAGNILLRFN